MVTSPSHGPADYAGGRPSAGGKAAEGHREVLIGEPDPGAGGGRADARDEGREHGGRRAGILLIVVGCVLMALAAGEAAASPAEEPGGGRCAPVEAPAGLTR